MMTTIQRSRKCRSANERMIRSKQMARQAMKARTAMAWAKRMMSCGSRLSPVKVR